MHIQFEQEKLLTSYVTAYDFIRQYNLVYNIQKDTPFKVFISCILPLETFEVLFFQELFSTIECNNLHHNFNLFKKYSKLIANKYEYQDEEFLSIVKKVYKRATEYFINKIDDNSNLYDVAEVMFFFGKPCTSLFIDSIDLNKFRNINDLVKNIIRLKVKFEEMNRIFERSFDVCDGEIFSIDEIVKDLNDKMKKLLKCMNKEEGYLICMEYVSEMVLNELCYDENIVNDMKCFSAEMLKK